MPVRKEIVYPIFLECCQYAESDFWKTIFEDLSYGIPPYGSYISKGFLCCSYKGKEFNYKIGKSDPKKIFKRTQKLLVNRMGILSKKEKRLKNKNFQDLETSIQTSRETWKGIRKKNVKNLLVETFVIDMKKKYNLSLDQSKNLLSLILISIMFKVIPPESICYDGTKITSINDIEFSDKCYKLNKDIYKLRTPLTSNPPPEQKNISLGWSKYIKDITSDGS